jgi:integrase
MAVYPEKRKGKYGKHGVIWIAEITVNGVRAGRERFKTHEEAQRWYNHMKLLGAPPPGGNDGKPAEPQGPSVAAVADEALRNHPAWVRGRDVNVRQRVRYIEDLWGPEMPIKDVGRKDLDKLVSSLRMRPGYEGRKRMTPASINRYLAAASVLLHFAKDREYRPDVPSIPRQPDDAKRIHWLSVEEEQAVSAAMLAGDVDYRGKGQDCELAMRVLIRTGMRWGEFEGLTPQMVTERWVRLDKTKTDTPRDIPIVPELAAELRQMVVERRVPKRQTFAECLARALKSAGQNLEITPHSLRHTCATRLVLAGYPLAKVQLFMGHSDIKTTMKYTHVAPKHLEDAAEILSCTAGQSRGPVAKGAEHNTQETPETLALPDNVVKLKTG